MVFDIQGGKKYPSNALSNFAPHTFVIDSVKCASMEGFLQSLKFKNPDMQAEICKLVGMGAKNRGRHKNWQRNQTLYWRGKAIKRESAEYQELLNRAYEALSANEAFQAALLATGNATLDHVVGRTDPKITVLTRREFVSRLTAIRTRLQAKQSARAK